MSRWGFLILATVQAWFTRDGDRTWHLSTDLAPALASVLVLIILAARLREKRARGRRPERNWYAKTQTPRST